MVREIISRLIKTFHHPAGDKNIFPEPESAPMPAQLSRVQELFIQWNALRLGITTGESLERYRKSWQSIPQGHGGVGYRDYCDRSHKVHQVFYNDSPGEVFESYKLHAHMHFLRMLSYPDHTWNAEDVIVKSLPGDRPISILDFGCGLAPRSRPLAEYLMAAGKSPVLYLADIPTIRKDFLIWVMKELGINGNFLDCTAAKPVPDLPACDICFATEFFEHVHDPLAYFKKIHDALCAGGLLITNTLDHGGEYMHVSPDLHRLRDLIRSLGYAEPGPGSIYRKNDGQPKLQIT